MIINAKSELQEHISIITTTYNIHIKCMECTLYDTSDTGNDEKLVMCYLPCGFSENDKQELLESMDIEYEDFCEDVLTLDGCIWWSDGSWSIRDVDEDSVREMWMLNLSPPLPSHLKRRGLNNVVSLFGGSI